MIQNPSTYAISVRELSYTYPGASRHAVDRMTFDVQAGEIFGFLGPSGAGKTTAQRILVGLLHGWEGDVELLGRELRTWDRRLYDRLGVGFELPCGYARLSARENLEHFACLHGSAPRDPDELLTVLGLHDVADEPLASFSKGMRTRLDIARALLHRPELLFLDEPTSGLDPTTARRVRDLILEERDAGRTVFLTTHDMSAAHQLCDRVAFVVDGRMVACDRPRALELAAGTRSIRVEHRTPDGLVATTLPLEGDGGALAELLAAGGVETVHTTEASLEEVFVAVTGRAL